MLVVIPVLAVAVGLSVAFAFQPEASQPKQQPTDDCTLVAGNIKSLVVDIDGEGQNETRQMAASALMNEYCARPELVGEIGSMGYPGVGLISYGCDVASGRLDNIDLKNSLQGYAPIYCEGATAAILERTEWTLLAVHDFREEMNAYLEDQKDTFDRHAQDSDSGPSIEYPWVQTSEIKRIEARLVELTSETETTRSLALDDGHYYDAAKSLESVTSSLKTLGSELYS